MTGLTAEQRAALREAVQQADLGEYLDVLEAVAIPAIHCRPTDSTQPRPVGTSRFGGMPDLPPGISWPTFDEGYFMVFVGQINLSDLPSVQDNPLPAFGILYFFIAHIDYGRNIPHRVIYFEGDTTTLQPAQQPPVDRYLEQEEYHPYKSCYLDFKTGLALPDYTRKKNPALQLNHEQWKRYYNLDSKLSGFRGRFSMDRSQMLGIPEDFSGHLFRDAQKVSEGRSLYKHDDEPSDEKIAQWRLLIQIGSHNEAEMLWSDAGFLQYIIHIDDLDRRDFSKTYACIQSS